MAGCFHRRRRCRLLALHRVGSRVIGFLPGYVAEEGLVSGTGFWVLDMIRHAVSRAARCLSRPLDYRDGGADDRRFASAGRPGLEPTLDDRIGHCGIVLRLTPLSVVLRLSRCTAYCGSMVGRPGG